MVNRNIGNVRIEEIILDGRRIQKHKVLISRIYEIYEFTKNLFLGLRELARNIIDHTDTGIGVLTARINSSNTLFELKGKDNFNEVGFELSQYAEKINLLNNSNLDTKRQDFLDISIFDSGNEGVISKTISNIKKIYKINSEHIDLYEEDLNKLEKGEVTFSAFFNTNDFLLNHHAIRTASHWGLIIFSNLINKNKGLFSASSHSYKSENSFDNCFSFFNTTSNVLNPSVAFEYGTFYNII